MDFKKFHIKHGVTSTRKIFSELNRIKGNLNTENKRNVFDILTMSKIIEKEQKGKQELQKIDKKFSKQKLQMDKFRYKAIKPKEVGRIRELLKQKQLETLNSRKKLMSKTEKQIVDNLIKYQNKEKLEKDLLKFFNDVELMRFDRIFPQIQPLYEANNLETDFDSLKPLKEIISNIMSKYPNGSLEKSVYEGIHEKLKTNPKEFFSKCKDIGNEIKQIEIEIKKQGNYYDFKREICTNEL